jgi:hypothetical protein
MSRDARSTRSTASFRGKRAVAALLVCGMSAGIAAAAGGPTIARAPELRDGRPVRGGGAANRSVEYYRLPLNARDITYIEFVATSTRIGSDVRVDVFSPEVTDATVQEARPVARGATRTTHQLRFQAPRRGRWIVRVRTPPAVGYHLAAWLLRVTRATMSGPRSVRAGGRGLFRGRISGVATGSVVFQSTRGRGWRTLGTAAIRRGLFSFRRTFSAPGVYRSRVVFAGDRSHQGSASNVVVTRAI